MNVKQVRDRIRALSNPEGINQYTKGGGSRHGDNSEDKSSNMNKAAYDAAVKSGDKNARLKEEADKKASGAGKMKPDDPRANYYVSQKVTGGSGWNDDRPKSGHATFDEAVQAAKARRDSSNKDHLVFHKDGSLLSSHDAEGNDDFNPTGDGDSRVKHGPSPLKR